MPELEPEIVVMLITSLIVTVMLAIIQMRRISLRKTEREYDLDSLNVELSRRLKGTSKRSVEDVQRRLQWFDPDKPESKKLHWVSLVFWLALFFCFCWWAFGLMKGGYSSWPIVPAVAALISAIVPFLMCWESEHERDFQTRFLRAMERYKRACTPDKAASQPALAETQGFKPESDSPVKHDTNIVQSPDVMSRGDSGTAAGGVDIGQKPASSKPVVQRTAAKTPVRKPAPPFGDMPEDSTLKRHYVTMQRYAIMADLPDPPTDFTLRRHYDTMVVTELQKRLPQTVGWQSSSFRSDPVTGYSRSSGLPKPVVEPAVVSESVPEDLTLKRHYLGMLRNEILSNLPPRPSDCTLRRHYDALIEAALAKRLRLH